jgi:hypothetical protein
MNATNTVTEVTTTVGTYHVFGSGGSSTWFRQTREGATSPKEFFAAVDAVKEDGGDNGFVGTYEVSGEFMNQNGWEAKTMYWPPCNDYTQTPQVSDGWLSRRDWLNGGLEALSAKIPTFKAGFHYESNHMRTREVVFVENEESHRKAILDGHTMHYFSDISDGVHEVDFQWGDQAATAFLLIKDGKKVDYIAGCGDRTPYLTESNEKCLADGQLHHSDSMTDAVIAQGEYEDAFWATAERIGVADQYRTTLNAEYSEDNNKISGAIARRINEAMVREEANSRADADKFGILRRLLKHYRKHQNPLRSLRKEKGGVWTFHREKPSNLPAGAEVFFGDNWWVVWVK